MACSGAHADDKSAQSDLVQRAIDFSKPCASSPCSGARADDKFTHSELVRALARRPEHAASKVLKELDISTKLK